MKKNKVINTLLALALTGAIFMPNVEKSFATEASSQAITSNGYLGTHTKLLEAISKAKNVKNDYRYLNASKFYKENFDNMLKEAESTYTDAPLSTENSMVLEIVKKAADNLEKAISELDGKLADTKNLKTLIDYEQTFYKSDLYKYSTYAKKNAYEKAITDAKNYLDLGASRLAQAKINEHLLNISKAMQDLDNSYRVIKAKTELKEEIKKSSPLRNQSTSFGKASFEAFISALRLAETSVEDAAAEKSEQEYKELKEALETARRALIEIKPKNEDSEKQIKRLEEAIARNQKTTVAAKLLINKYPETIKSVRKDLEDLVTKSEKLIVEANELILKIKNKGIKG